MSRMVVGFAAAVSFMLASSASALAQTAPATPQQPAAKQTTPDPNEVVCEKQQDSSSRIATKRVCMTRSQWAEQRRLNRQDIEKVQTQRPCVDTSC